MIDRACRFCKWSGGHNGCHHPKKEQFKYPRCVVDYCVEQGYYTPIIDNQEPRNKYWLAPHNITNYKPPT